MNLILTDKCTNSCPYCFAALEMQKTTRKNSLSREDFDIFMSFVEREASPIDVNVIGGEPLIYKDLDYVLNRLYESNKVSYFTVFTGGIVQPNVIESLSIYRTKMSILFNVNEKKTYRNPNHYDIVVENIKHALNCGIRCGIGFNIYHHDFDGTQILNLCCQFGINILRFSVACPIYGEKSSFIVPPEEYDRLGRKVYKFLVECSNANVETNLDCPLPLCFFTNEELGNLVHVQPNVVNRLERCHAALDINYDLKVFRCFSLSSCTDVHLTDFTSFNEIRNYFSEQIDSHLLVPRVFPDCKTCKNVTRCAGGCLSNNQSFMELPTKNDLIKEVFMLIQDEKIDEALDKLHQIPIPTASEYLLEAKLLLHLDRHSEARTMLYRCINIALSTHISNEAVRLLNQL